MNLAAIDLGSTINNPINLITETGNFFHRSFTLNDFSPLTMQTPVQDSQIEGKKSNLKNRLY
jgi:hypothetical protein